MLRPTFIASHPPTHLLRTDALSQREFFSRRGDFRLTDWKIEETGWPYICGGLVKRSIAHLARAIGGHRLFGIGFGNRFRAVLVKEAHAVQVADRWVPRHNEHDGIGA